MTDMSLDIERAVVVAQLVEWLLLKPEIRSSNPIVGKKNFYGIEKIKIKKKWL